MSVAGRVTAACRRYPRARSATIALAALAVAGCSGAPARVTGPRINASRAASAAVKFCDRNGDAAVTQQEAASSPGLAAAFRGIDTDANGSLSAAEIEARIASWAASGKGIAVQPFYVLLDGKPLAGGKVELVPEPYLAKSIGTAESMISDAGMCSPSVAADSLPKGIPAGLNFGLYSVRITHPKATVPPRYNAATTLGMEVCPDYDFFNPMRLRLESK
jgi:hypothetical protein